MRFLLSFVWARWWLPRLPPTSSPTADRHAADRHAADRGSARTVARPDAEWLVTKRQMPDCPWCDEPMYRREPDLEEEPYFLTDWSLMHHACLLELRDAIALLMLPNTEAGAREAIRLSR